MHRNRSLGGRALLLVALFMGGCLINDVPEDCQDKVKDLGLSMADPIDLSELNIRYLDDDGDGYGDPDAGTCEPADDQNYADNDDDCNDNHNGISPDAPEQCNDGVDNDCDGRTDCQDAYCSPAPMCDPGDVDGDNDGVPKADDCNDNNPEQYPGNTENCLDGQDNDCDGLADMDDPDCCGADC